MSATHAHTLAQARAASESLQAAAKAENARFTSLREIVQSFCGPHDIRKYLRAPFLRDGFVYASNGSWAVRVPADQYPGETPAPTAKEAPKNIDKLISQAPWDRLQPLPPFTAPACTACRGTGRAHVGECAACGGKGEFVHHGIWYGCMSCDGEGRTETAARADDAATTACSECDGLGLEREFEGEWIAEHGGQWFQRRYLAHLSRLPGIQFGCNPLPPGALDATNGRFVRGDSEVNRLICAAFRWDGGEGVLMPCEPPRSAKAAAGQEAAA